MFVRPPSEHVPAPSDVRMRDAARSKHDTYSRVRRAYERAFRVLTHASVGAPMAPAQR